MLPIRDTVRSTSFPIVTWLFIALNAVVFLYEISLPSVELNALIMTFGLIPGQLGAIRAAQAFTKSTPATHIYDTHVHARRMAPFPEQHVDFIYLRRQCRRQDGIDSLSRFLPYQWIYWSTHSSLYVSQQCCTSHRCQRRHRWCARGILGFISKSQGHHPHSAYFCALVYRNTCCVLPGNLACNPNLFRNFQSTEFRSYGRCCLVGSYRGFRFRTSLSPVVPATSTENISDSIWMSFGHY